MDAPLLCALQSCSLGARSQHRAKILPVGFCPSTNCQQSPAQATLPSPRVRCSSSTKHTLSPLFAFTFQLSLNTSLFSLLFVILLSRLVGTSQHLCKTNPRQTETEWFGEQSRAHLAPHGGHEGGVWERTQPGSARPTAASQRMACADPAHVDAGCSLLP